MSYLPAKNPTPNFRKDGFPVPNIIDPPNKRCIQIEIPDDDDHVRLFLSALTMLTKWTNYQITRNDHGQKVAKVWQQIIDDTNFRGDGCVPEQISVNGVGADAIGSVVAYATKTPPDGTLLCDGQTYLRVQYPELYAVLDNAFIVDADNFIVPDLRGRVIVGYGDADGLANRLMGVKGGFEEITLDADELPEHDHNTSLPGAENYFLTTIPGSNAFIPGVNNSSSAGWTLYAKNNVNAFRFGTIATTGLNNDAGGSHNNMQPFIVLRYCIRFEAAVLAGIPGAPGNPGRPGDCDCNEPTDPESPPPQEIGLYPPGTDLKCAAAISAVQWIDNNILSALINIAGGVSTLMGIAILLAGVITVVVFGFSAVTALLVFGIYFQVISLFLADNTQAEAIAEWGAPFKDALKCYIYCNLNDDNQFTPESFANFKAQINDETDDKWEIIRLINAMLGHGFWNNIMQLKIATGVINCTTCVDCLPELVRGSTGRKDGITYLGNDRWKVVSVDGSAAINDGALTGQLLDGSCFYMRNITTSGNFPSVAGWTFRRCNNTTFTQRHPTVDECMKSFSYIKVPNANYAIEFDLIKVDGVCD